MTHSRRNKKSPDWRAFDRANQQGGGTDTTAALCSNEQCTTASRNYQAPHTNLITNPVQPTQRPIHALIDQALDRIEHHEAAIRRARAAIEYHEQQIERHLAIRRQVEFLIDWRAGR